MEVVLLVLLLPPPPALGRVDSLVGGALVAAVSRFESSVTSGARGSVAACWLECDGVGRGRAALGGRHTVITRELTDLIFVGLLVLIRTAISFFLGREIHEIEAPHANKT